ncbi:MAG: aspartate kinase [Candidatus Aenigmarchaeota archaeon]|nr:aspartate kinase [Candidatus Aenigmarchaeota archaeon]
MTAIIKYGPQTIQEPADLERISRQIKAMEGNNGRIVIVTVPLRDTTDRLVETLDAGNGRKGRQVFGAYEALIQQLDDNRLTTNFESACRQFDNMLLGGRSHNIDEILVASGYELTAQVLNSYLVQSGINSTLVDHKHQNFPIRQKEERRKAVIDLEGSKEAAERIPMRDGVIVVPGYTVFNDGLARTLGRGGGDTASFIAAYAFGADVVWVIAEDALTTAPYGRARVVDEIDLDEAWAAGFFGASLRTPSSVEPLKTFLETHPNSQVYIAGMNGQRKTRINPGAKKQTVRFIASRDVDTYGIRGEWRGVISELYRNPTIDWFTYGGIPGGLGIGVSERGRELAKAIVNHAVDRKEIQITYQERVSYIGVVGSGMSDAKGIAKRAYSALRGINIQRTHDPNAGESHSTSIGIMLDPRYERQAVESLHREFFNR